MIFDELTKAIFAEVDRVILAGSGSGQEPLGLMRDSAVPTVAAGTNGAAPTWALLTEMERTYAANCGMQNPSWVTNAALRKKLRNTQQGTNLPYCWSDDNQLLGYDAAVSEHAPGDFTKGTGTGLSGALLGDMSSVLIGQWGPQAVDAIINPYSLAYQGLIRIDAFMEIGVGFRHEKAFVKCTDLVTS
jgi:HK97 family phage major capsid protein